MIKQHPVSTVYDTRAKGLLRGLAVSVGTTAIFTALASWAILKELVPQMWIGYLAMGIILLSVMLGTKMALREIRTGIMIQGAICALLYWLTLMVLNLVLCKGEYNGVWVTLFLALGGGISAVFMKFEPKRKKHPRKQKYWNG